MYVSPPAYSSYCSAVDAVGHPAPVGHPVDMGPHVSVQLPPAERSAEKDDGEPAFMVWSWRMRMKIAAENPKMDNLEISKQLDIQWKMVTNEERWTYVNEAKRLSEPKRRKKPTPLRRFPMDMEGHPFMPRPAQPDNPAALWNPPQQGQYPASIQVNRYYQGSQTSPSPVDSYGYAPSLGANGTTAAAYSIAGNWGTLSTDCGSGSVPAVCSSLINGISCQPETDLSSMINVYLENLDLSTSFEGLELLN